MQYWINPVSKRALESWLGAYTHAMKEKETVKALYDYPALTEYLQPLEAYKTLVLSILDRPRTPISEATRNGLLNQNAMLDAISNITCANTMRLGEMADNPLAYGCKDAGELEDKFHYGKYIFQNRLRNVSDNLTEKIETAVTAAEKGVYTASLVRKRQVPLNAGVGI